MIVNKSMFPLQTGFSVISQMQQKFSELQVQLGTGEKSSTLAGMGRDLPLSLSVRSRLTRIEGFSSNIDQVNLRLSFLDKTMTRLDALESEVRGSAVQGQYGTNNINMSTLPGLSKARLDELVTMMNADVAGRYLFAGAKTDKPPVAETNVLLEGQGGRAGLKTVITERKAADAGADGQGRLQVIQTVASNVVHLAEDGVHPFGFKVSAGSTSSAGVTVSPPGPATPLGDLVTVTFLPTPAEQIRSGETITLGLTLPDGTETQVVMRAVTSAEQTGAAGEFLIGTDAAATAASFNTALGERLVEAGRGELAAASTVAASQNFFNGPGEPVLRVAGNPASSQGFEVGTAANTVMWYSGETPAVVAANMGRLNVSTVGDTVTLGETVPVSSQHGFKITNVSGDSANIDNGLTIANPSSVTVQFDGLPLEGENLHITLTGPDGKQHTLTMSATSGAVGARQFAIGSDVNATAANFAAALKTAVTELSAMEEGTARQSVSAQVDDATRVSYGVQANEAGLLAMMRTLGGLAVETYPTEESIRATREPQRLAATAMAPGAARDAALADYEKALKADLRASLTKFDAMAVRQASALSEGHNAERGSIEMITMELGVAQSAAKNATARHTSYKAQLDSLLSEVETVSKEEVAMEILALQTRLTASYQTTSMVSQLSLVNFL
jgi:flagellar hook-associated protein 3 FlgL